MLGELEIIAQNWAQTLLLSSDDKRGKLQQNESAKLLKLGESIVSKWIPNTESPPDRTYTIHILYGN